MAHIINSKLTDKLSFGAARFATTIFSAFIAYYLMGFCTDTALIPPAATAVIIFCLRIFDVINDQFTGVFINRNNYKDGKYRPYLKWCALPFALSFMLIGWVPGFGLTGKIIYISVMLAVCELMSTVLNTAELSMLPYLAKDDMGRVKFMSFSNIGAVLSFFIIGTFMLPLVNIFNKIEGRGYLLTNGYLLPMGLFAAISVPAHLWAYRGLKDSSLAESSALAPFSNKASIKEMFLLIIKNKRLIIFLAGYCLYYMADTFKSQTAYYYMTYNMNRQDLLPAVIMAGLLSALLFQPFIPQLIKLASKEVLMIAGLLTAGASSLMMLAAGNQPLALIICQVFYGISTAVTANLVFTVVASFSDEMLEQKKTPMSEILISVMALSANFGAAVSGGIAPLVLAATGYAAQAAQQTALSLTGIKILYIGAASVGMILAGVFMLLYRAKGSAASKSVISLNP